jgi:drug/metabolite transporter (DMT)-like permease
MTPSERLADNRRGILFMIGASTAFIASDTLVKLAADSLPIGQIIFLRGLLVAPLLIGTGLYLSGRRVFEPIRHGIVWWRTFGEVGATILYLSALAHMPIANSTAILQVVPLAVTAAAAIGLGEKVGIRRWSAIGVGLAAVIVIVRPGLEGFNAWSMAALASVAFIVIRDLTSRMLPRSLPISGVTGLSGFCVTLVGAAMLPYSGWNPVTPATFVVVIGAAVALAFGYVLIVLAMRNGEVSVVAPFRYVILLWAIVAQILVFATWPDALMLIGSAVLVMTGLYTLYRERKVVPEPAARPAAQAQIPPPV